MPLPFLPNAKPRNLKFRIANTLTVRLLSLFTVNFNFSSRYFILLSKSLSDAHLLFANNTMSSTYLIQDTPRLMNSLSNSFRYIFTSNDERLPPCEEPSSVSITTPFSITPLFRYLLISCITLSSFISRNYISLTTMTSADFCVFSIALQPWLLLSEHFTQTSLGTTRFLLSIYLPHLSCTIPCSYWASTWIAALPSYITLYVISVRQTRDLPVG